MLLTDTHARHEQPRVQTQKALPPIQNSKPAIEHPPSPPVFSLGHDLAHGGVTVSDEVNVTGCDDAQELAMDQAGVGDDHTAEVTVALRIYTHVKQHTRQKAAIMGSGICGNLLY